MGSFEEQQHRTKSGRATPPFHQGSSSVFSLSLLNKLFPAGANLLPPEVASINVDIDGSIRLPPNFQKHLDLQTGRIWYSRESTKMSRNGKNPKLDLKLNLSPPRGNRRGVMPNWAISSPSVSPTSPPSSCVSTEPNVSGDSEDQALRCSNSPEATSMVLAGCPRCLMYVMLSEEDPKCPKCKSTVLLDFLHENTNNICKKNRNN